MNWFWLNMPLAAAFFGAWTGVPMWMVFKRPDQGPAPLAVQAPALSHQTVPARPRIAVVSQRGGHLAGVR